MIKFYKIENGKALVGSGIKAPEGFIEYTDEPQELKDALALEKSSQLLQQFMNQIESWLDQVAAERGYKSMERLVGYVGDPVPLWDAEGQAGLKFRSAVWVKAVEIQEAVIAGKRSMPTIEEVIKEMPEIEWPKVDKEK